MNIISISYKVLRLILYVSIVLEMCIFPSWSNLWGCLMGLICWQIFSTYFLKQEVIIKYPFAFMMYLSMFFYRYLPLPATLLEGKPITYGLQLPYLTFFYETLLFVVSSLAFRLAFVKGRRNNGLQKLLKEVRFFDVYPISIIWILGMIGILARLSSFAAGSIEYGDVGGKFINGLVYLMYVPFVLLFPRLYRTANSLMTSMNRKVVWGYFIFVTLLGIASNSREGMIAPIALLFLLYFLQSCKFHNERKRKINVAKIVLIGVAVYWIMGVLADFSMAMLYTRNIRSDVSKTELLEKTVNTYRNKELMASLKQMAQLEKENELMTYKQGWDETYVDNFMLNRYCNIRITDQTLYYAFHLSDEDKVKMKQHFINRAIITLPTPILHFLGIRLDKNDFSYSRGDLLYALGRNTTIFPGFRVTSHVGDGLATWGLLYFFIQFIFFFFVFKLLNSLIYFSKNAPIYSLYGLISLFTFFGMFRNANGCIEDLEFCLRGYWQNVILFSSAYLLVLFISNLTNILGYTRQRCNIQ